MKKVVITGPESTGKSTLVSDLAKRFDASFVPEYSRLYLQNLNRLYDEPDILEIAKGQIMLEEAFFKKGGKIMFMDTDLTVLKIWSEYKFGRCHPWIEEQLELRDYDLFLLCKPDIPWVYDPLREHPNERQEIYELYIRSLKERKIDYVSVEGDYTFRLERAIVAVQNVLDIK